MARMLLVTHGTDGDVLPFVRLGRTLRGRGHDVTLITHAPYGPAATEAGLGFVAIDTAEAYERQLADTEGLLAGRAPGRWLEFYRRHGLFEQALLEFRAIAERYEPGRTVLVGRHTSTVSVLMAAEAHGAPAAWVAVSPVQIMAAAGAAHLYATVLHEGLSGVRAAAGLPVAAGRAVAGPPPDLELGLWPRWFDQAGARSARRVRLTGFPLADDRPHEIPPEAEELLAGPVRPVLVSGGTGRMLHPRFYPAAVEACRRAGLPALLVVRHPELVPGPLPPAVRRVAALPFREVMPRAGAILHHGGIGTLARALAAGAPQVILAHGVDRPDNAERLAALGLARWLPAGRWEPDRIAVLLRSAAAGAPAAMPAAMPAGAPAGRASSDGSGDGVDMAADAIEGLADRDGPARTGGGAPDDGTPRVRPRSLPSGRRRALLLRRLEELRLEEARPEDLRLEERR